MRLRTKCTFQHSDKMQNGIYSFETLYLSLYFYIQLTDKFKGKRTSFTLNHKGTRFSIGNYDP